MYFSFLQSGSNGPKFNPILLVPSVFHWNTTKSDLKRRTIGWTGLDIVDSVPRHQTGKAARPLSLPCSSRAVVFFSQTLLSLPRHRHTQIHFAQRLPCVRPVLHVLSPSAGFLFLYRLPTNLFFFLSNLSEPKRSSFQPTPILLVSDKTLGRFVSSITARTPHPESPLLVVYLLWYLRFLVQGADSQLLPCDSDCVETTTISPRSPSAPLSLQPSILTSIYANFSPFTLSSAFSNFHQRPSRT